MSTSLRLLQLALLLMWGQLLINGALQPMVAIAIPVLLGISGRPELIQPKGRLLTLTLLTLAAWLASTPLHDRNGWMASLGNLVWLMGGLKLLESSDPPGRRRASLVMLLGIGLAGTLSQSLVASVMQGVCSLCCVGSLLSLEAGPQPLNHLLRRCVGLVGVLLPVVITAFLLLPRLPVLWSLPGGSGISQSGLASELRPGDIAELVRQGGLAARVEFAGAPPPPQQRYWRVLVHRHFDGEGWSQGPAPALASNQPTPTAPVDQRWLVEPSPLPWRPWGGEGLPSDPSLLRLSSAGALWAGVPLRERELYGISSSSRAKPWRAQPPTDLDLELPQGSNPRLEALAAQLRSESRNPAMLVSQTRRWFETQGFRYSLEPGKLPAQAPLDAFLFDRQLGFCEHFASSFSTLMRAAGVPARVVVGYQGGTWKQPLAGDPYLLLEQSDAHAWSEVWLPPSGWVEVDPTSWVVPDRVRLSLAASLSANERQQLQAGAPPSWLQGLASQWQGLDTRWQLWVMGFDTARQRELLPGWFTGQWQGVMALLVIGLGLGGALSLVLRLESGPGVSDPPRRSLNHCLRQLKSLQLEPTPGESLGRFLQRAGQEHPPLQPLLNRVLDLYNQYRFGAEPQTQAELVRGLRAATRQLQGFARRRRT